MDQLRRLQAECLPDSDTSIRVPGYERDERGIGIVHLGIGAFHRAHQAVYTDEALGLDGGDWKILGVSLRSADVRDQLEPQDGLYTLVEMDASAAAYRVIGSVGRVLVAPEDPRAVIDALTADGCRIISLTITEKGYCHDPATGCLNRKHPDIVYDWANPLLPKTALGFICEALRVRRSSDAAIPTVLCCDNLPSNGDTLRNLIIEFARRRDADLADWIATHVPFPNSMVDRIVPATRPADIDRAAAVCGYRDLGMVKAEAFTQWVIEDRFASGRPSWERTGVTMVADVEPFEIAKLRLLNGPHSTLAYLGYLAGYEYAHDVMADADFRAYLRGLMCDEIIPTVAPPPGMDLRAYADSLLARVANPALEHKTCQIAMDGSQKLPQRLLGTVRDRLAAGGGVEHLALAVAAWMRYVMAFDEQGAPIAVQDPLADDLKLIARQSTDGKLVDIQRLVGGYLAVETVFGKDLRDNTVLQSRIIHWLGHMLANGVATTLKIFRATKHPHALEASPR